jgi:hypothetical protein
MASSSLMRLSAESVTMRVVGDLDRKSWTIGCGVHENGEPENVSENEDGISTGKFGDKISSWDIAVSVSVDDVVQSMFSNMFDAEDSSGSRFGE